MNWLRKLNQRIVHQIKHPSERSSTEMFRYELPQTIELSSRKELEDMLDQFEQGKFPDKIAEIFAKDLRWIGNTPYFFIASVCNAVIYPLWFANP